MHTNIRAVRLALAGLMAGLLLAGARAEAQHLFRRVGPGAGQRPAAGGAARPQNVTAPAPSQESAAADEPAQATAPASASAASRSPGARLQSWWNGTAPWGRSSFMGAAAAAAPPAAAPVGQSPAGPQLQAAAASAAGAAPSPAPASSPVGAPVVNRAGAGDPAQASAAAAPSRSIFDYLRFAAPHTPGGRPAAGLQVRPASTRSLLADGSRPLPQAASAPRGQQSREASAAQPAALQAVSQAQASAASMAAPEASASGEAARVSEVPVASQLAAAPSDAAQAAANSSAAALPGEPLLASSPPPPVRRIAQVQAAQPHDAYDLIRALQQAHQRDLQEEADQPRPISVVAQGTAPRSGAVPDSAPPRAADSSGADAVAAPPARLLASPSFVAPAASVEPARIDAPANPSGGLQPSAAGRQNLADVRLAVYDPRGIVALGDEVFYEIHVNNHGPQPARNIQVLVTVDPALTLVSAQGMGAKTAVSSVVFDNIPQLPPHALQILRFSVRANQPGGHQFRVELASTDPRLRQAIEGTTQFGR